MNERSSFLTASFFRLFAHTNSKFRHAGGDPLKKWQVWLPFFVLLLAAAGAWAFRRQLTAEAIAARSPEQLGAAVCFLLALYAVKSLSVAFPLSALEAAGGLLFPLPAALAVNLCGVAIVQTLPYLLGQREQGGLAAITARYPRLAGLGRPDPRHSGRTVFLLRLGGASPGDLISLYLGAAGVPWRTYLTGGLLGSLPRVVSATLLGSALWKIGGTQFWLSLGTGAALTALALGLWRFWQTHPAH